MKRPNKPVPGNAGTASRLTIGLPDPIRCARKLKDDGHIGVIYSEMNGARKALIRVLVAILAGLAVLFGGIWILFSIVFFQNFHLPNLWHCFVLLYTLATPVLSGAGFFIFWCRPSAKTAILSISASLAVGAIFLLWFADGSRGLIH